jgi:small subunit ribosomal protein S16
MNGAQPTDTVKAMLSFRGVLLKKHLQIGVLKGALTQEQADSKLADWLNEKEAKISARVDKITRSKQADTKARKDAEIKVKEARAEAIRKKSIVVEASAEGENAPAEEAQEQAPASEEAAASAEGNTGAEAKGAES